MGVGLVLKSDSKKIFRLSFCCFDGVCVTGRRANAFLDVGEDKAKDQEPLTPSSKDSFPCLTSSSSFTFRSFSFFFSFFLSWSIKIVTGVPPLELVEGVGMFLSFPLGVQGTEALLSSTSLWPYQ